jgi:three-Cys-motif partner protein
MAETDDDYWLDYSNLQRVKHELIRQYLGGWVPKLTLGEYGQSKVLYFDTHAGRGVHKDGEMGSPLVALKTVTEHSMFSRFAGKEIRFIFFENSTENAKALEAELRKFPTLPKNVIVNIESEDCFKRLDELLTALEKSKISLAPSFVFCDPFGFKIPGSILKRLMRFRGVELFINIIWRELDMAIGHGHSGKPGWIKTLNEVFDGDSWQSIDPKSDVDTRAEACVQLLRKITGATLATYIRMLGGNGATRYFLMHLTNHDAGRDLMKACFWSACPEEGYYVRKSDNPDQQRLIKPEPDLTPVESWVIEQLSKGPKRWKDLHEMMREGIWLDKHVNAVVRELRNAGAIKGSDHPGKFTPSNNPLLTLVSN